MRYRPARSTDAGDDDHRSTLAVEVMYAIINERRGTSAIRDKNNTVTEIERGTIRGDHGPTSKEQEERSTSVAFGERG